MEDRSSEAVGGHTADRRRDWTTFARLSDVASGPYRAIITELNRINSSYGLADHSDLNSARYPWSQEYLEVPQFYASRAWEYPWAILHAKLQPGLECADVGCGESPFAIYLKDIAGCQVTGFDSTIRRSKGVDNFGVSEAYIDATGIRVIECSLDALTSDECQFDRVFCMSVMEHVPDSRVRSRGMSEIARVLKPGGLALITVDVNLLMRLTNPLELAWESGLTFYGGVDLAMPESRLGIFADGLQPADVFGMVLTKEGGLIDTHYGDQSERVDAWRAALLRDTFPVHTLSSLVRRDMERNVRNDRPSLRTRLRVASKFLLNRYPNV